MGSGVFATKNFQPGDTIWSEQPIFVLRESLAIQTVLEMPDCEPICAAMIARPKDKNKDGGDGYRCIMVNHIFQGTIIIIISQVYRGQLKKDGCC